MLKLQFITLFFNFLTYTYNLEYSTTIDPTQNFGVWEGWGTSLAWWANVHGNRDDIADILFTMKDTYLKEQGETLPGLGFNIARYNAGACSNNTYEGASMVASWYIPKFKQIEGFLNNLSIKKGYWLDWESKDPKSKSWDWSRDQNQRNMLKKAVERGTNILELFSNSPMWWMCKNHNPSGHNLAIYDNLQTWNQEDHAYYLTTIANHAQKNWGIHFDYIQAFNEPISLWWNFQGTQEGCHFSHETQQTVTHYLNNFVKNMSKTYISAADENTYDQTTDTWNYFNQETKDMITKINTHGYQETGGRRDYLSEATKGKKLWNSEYADEDASGMRLAEDLNLDLVYLHPTAWVYWQALDQFGWGLIESDLTVPDIRKANSKFYVLAQYSRHIRPGMTLLSGGEDLNTVSAYDSKNNKLVIITTNYGDAQQVTYNLDKFQSAKGPVTRWITNTSEKGDKYTKYQDVKLNNKSFKQYFTANTVMTFEIEGVMIIDQNEFIEI